ncbi:MAG: putative toxin-antitoxin system toxin component, PIN family [Sulfuriferula multivorans]|uniref:Putative toxin-antitoxin system toxin component, PIN family n=1 Tax=Sulfuriferula multivorans TaxID=1559896 RepID=A0A7C9NS14_9PROT|nr:putative toxin-antitoxin system toxin component, PIN family [Sulfuriferula multivorans]
MNKPLLVLDTNVVLDLLHFEDVIAQPILEALQHGRVDCAVTEETLEEFRRVLSYPEFELVPTRQATLLARYQSLAKMRAAVSSATELPHCSDPDDQKFLELAASSHAHTLVSKDRALLKLQRRCAPHFQVMTPAEAGRWLEDVS